MSGEERAGRGASGQYLPAGRGVRATPTPTSGPGAREPGAEPPPCLLTRALALTAGLGRGARASGRGRTTSPMPRLRASRRRGGGSSAFGPRRREPGCSRVREQLQDTDPARGGAEPGRGPRGAKESASGVRPGPRRVTSVLAVPGPPGCRQPAPPPARARPLLSRDLHRASPHLPRPPPRRGQVPSSAGLEDPLGISRKNVYCERKRKAQRRREREWEERARQVLLAQALFGGPWALPSLTPDPDPDGSRLFSAPPTFMIDPAEEAARPRGLLPPPHHTQRASPKPWSCTQGPLPPALVSFSALSLAFCSHHACRAVLHLLSLMPETSLAGHCHPLGEEQVLKSHLFSPDFHLSNKYLYRQPGTTLRCVTAGTLPAP